MSFPIDTTIPNAPNDPADDQPKMQTNFLNINSYLTVDHVAPGAIGNGFHKQVTYYTENTPLAPVDPISVDFTADASTLPVGITFGVASTKAQKFFRNQNGIFSSVSAKAFGSFRLTAPSTVTLLNTFNVSSISCTQAATTTIVVNYVANSLSSSSYVFHLNQILGLTNIATTKTSSSTTVVFTPALSFPITIDFLAMQV